MEDAVFEKERHRASLGLAVEGGWNAVKSEVGIRKIRAMGDFRTEEKWLLKRCRKGAPSKADDRNRQAAATAFDRFQGELEVVPAGSLDFFDQTGALREFPQGFEVGDCKRNAAFAQESLASLARHEEALRARAAKENLAVSLRTQAADMKNFRAAAGQAGSRFFQEKPSLDDGGVFHWLIVLSATMPTPGERVDAAGKKRKAAI